jgi:hypothetical protein
VHTRFVLLMERRRMQELINFYESLANLGTKTGECLLTWIFQNRIMKLVTNSCCKQTNIVAIWNNEARYS